MSSRYMVSPQEAHQWREEYKSGDSWTTIARRAGVSQRTARRHGICDPMLSAYSPPDSHIEAMCITCHGPIRKANHERPIFYCSKTPNCRSITRNIRVKDTIHIKYEAIRAMHAYRRELEAVRAHIGRLIGETGSSMS